MIQDVMLFEQKLRFKYLQGKASFGGAVRVSCSALIPLYCASPPGGFVGRRANPRPFPLPSMVSPLIPFVRRASTHVRAEVRERSQTLHPPRAHSLRAIGARTD
jgi:hypothetical protein